MTPLKPRHVSPLDRQDAARDRIWRGLERLVLLAGLALGLGLAPAAAETWPPVPATMELVPAPADGRSSRFLLLSLPLRPAPAGGFPIVLLVPDLDGPGPRTDAYALRLLENDFAVAEAYLANDPPGSSLADMAAALAPDPRLNPARLAAVALGAGARAALREWAEGAPVAALALLYPGCDAALAETARRAAPAARDTAVLLLHGGADTANPPMACAALSEALAGLALPTHHVLAGATYAWDATLLVAAGASLQALHPALPDGPRVLSRPDARTTLVAVDRVIAFLTGALRLAAR